MNMVVTSEVPVYGAAAAAQDTAAAAAEQGRRWVAASQP